jgi:hypothetical protein
VFGGEWEESPLQIRGTCYFFSVSSPNTIAIGCQNRTVEEWLESYEEQFEAHLFTEKQRSEYKRYFNLAADMYGWDVPRLAV